MVRISRGREKCGLVLLPALAWSPGIGKNRSQKRTQDSHTAFRQKKSLNSEGETVGERTGDDTNRSRKQRGQPDVIKNPNELFVRHKHQSGASCPECSGRHAPERSGNS